MKKISLALALAVMFAVAFGGAALAGAVKATGGVQYTEEGHFLTFNVHQRGDTAWGQVKNRTPDGGWYRAKVYCVNVVDGKTVRFAAEIIAGNLNILYIVFEVVDEGSPGTKGPDTVAAETFLDKEVARTNCMDTDYDLLYLWEVVSGNLVVHK